MPVPAPPARAPRPASGRGWLFAAVLVGFAGGLGALAWKQGWIDNGRFDFLETLTGGVFSSRPVERPRAPLDDGSDIELPPELLAAQSEPDADLARTGAAD